MRTGTATAPPCHRQGRRNIPLHPDAHLPSGEKGRQQALPVDGIYTKRDQCLQDGHRISDSLISPHSHTTPYEKGLVHPDRSQVGQAFSYMIVARRLLQFSHKEVGDLTQQMVTGIASIDTMVAVGIVEFAEILVSLYQRLCILKGILRMHIVVGHTVTDE